MKYIDLHSHSTASDGSFSPSELIVKAEEIGLSALALTDHDTVSGLPEFMEAASGHDSIEAIPGVEVSVEFKGKEVHIVGLFVDFTCSSFLDMLSEIRNHRNQRNELIITKLQGMGFDITLQELLDVAGGESIGRPLLAKILIEKRYFTEVQEVFDKCLKRGAPAYCARVLPTPERAIREIHNAGGVAIWAHPLYRAANDRTYLRKVLRELTKFGLDAVEAYYTSFNTAQTRAVMDVAEEFSLPLSGGSDFHGANQKGIELGRGFGELAVPYELLENLKIKIG
jgi:predicted metal-dependent phosphoesterase TrpH